MNRYSQAVACLLILVAVAQGATWNVSTFSGLTSAISSASNGDAILLAPGQYHVTSNLYITKTLTFQGTSGDRDDVVLYGNGMNVNSGPAEGIWTAANGIQIKDLTVKGFYNHGIHVCDAANGLADDVVISNVTIQNCGERYIKGSGTGISRNVLVDNVHFLQTETYLPRPSHPVDTNNYIGGIDAMHTDNWTIRDCRFDGIYGATGGGRGAIFLWNGCTNATIEGNVIVNCAEGINLGNGHNTSGGYHAEDAVVRNNTIVQYGADNRPVQLGYTRNIDFYNNTIYTPNNSNRAIHIYDSAAVPSSNVLLTNNLIRGNILNSTGGAVFANNITGATADASWFANVATGDLHLTAAATGAINQGIALPQVPTDMDGSARASSPDIGADERSLHGGDANKDGKVDVVDLGVLAKYYDTAAGATWAMADFSGDGAVDVVDLGVLAKNYDWTGAPAGAVPEPASMILLTLGGLALLRRRN